MRLGEIKKMTFRVMSYFVLCLDIFWVGDFVYRVANHLPFYWAYVDGFITCNLFLVFVKILFKVERIIYYLILIKKGR